MKIDLRVVCPKCSGVIDTLGNILKVSEIETEWMMQCKGCGESIQMNAGETIQLRSCAYLMERGEFANRSLKIHRNKKNVEYGMLSFSQVIYWRHKQDAINFLMRVLEHDDISPFEALQRFLLAKGTHSIENSVPIEQMTDGDIGDHIKERVWFETITEVVTQIMKNVVHRTTDGYLKDSSRL